jgi:hypothetical protein
MAAVGPIAGGRLQKPDLWERLHTDCIWVTHARTPLFGTVPERQFRMVVGLYLTGNMNVNTTIQIDKLEEDGITYTPKFSPIPVAPADFRQIPQSYSLDAPILTCEGGTRLYANTDLPGMSINTTIVWWDNDI